MGRGIVDGENGEPIRKDDVEGVGGKQSKIDRRG